MERNLKANHLKTASKYLSLLLRHQPELLDLDMDDNGWVAIQELTFKTQNQKVPFTPALIEELVRTSDKQRFAISDDGLSVRANQGHSISVDLNLEAVEPPAKLFHGTATRFKDGILSEGLIKRSRQHVHLSENLETATQVGKRHGKPIIFVVEALAMHKQGYEFYVSENNVWLTDEVPVEFLHVDKGFSHEGNC